MHESLGRRIAALRAQRGWTQQRLADRLAVSRVAVSHMEAGISIPGERTIALMAGLFRLEPHELVEGTSYPAAKAERLPLAVARYTEIEHQLDLMRSDLEWAARAGDEAVAAGWRVRLAVLRKTAHDPEERAAIDDAARRLRRS